MQGSRNGEATLQAVNETEHVMVDETAFVAWRRPGLAGDLVLPAGRQEAAGGPF